MSSDKVKDLLQKAEEEKKRSGSKSAAMDVIKNSIKIAPKKTTGCPPSFDSPDQMIILIDHYFEESEGRILLDDKGEVRLDKQDRPIIVGARPLTIAGLCCALGFSHRQSLNDYLKKPAFTDVILRAKLVIEAYTAEACFDREKSQGARFLLSAVYGYKVEKDVNHRSEVEVKHSVVSNLTDVEKLRLAENAQKYLASKIAESKIVEVLDLDGEGSKDE